jgi:hypothetical protein
VPPTPNHGRSNAIPEGRFGSATVETLGDRLADEVGHGHAFARGCRLQTPVEVGVHADRERFALHGNAPEREGRHTAIVGQMAYDRLGRPLEARCLHAVAIRQPSNRQRQT